MTNEDIFNQRKVAGMHVLENGVLKVEIADKGAELCRVWDQEAGCERIWSADPSVWNRHAPILFPFVGKEIDGKYHINGREYEMKTQHGFARDLEFACVEETTHSVSHVLCSSESTKAIFPFDFRLVVRHRLDEKETENRPLSPYSGCSSVPLLSTGPKYFRPSIVRSSN